MLRPRSLSLIALSALAILAGLLVWWFREESPPAQTHQRQPLALFTTLPLYWSEAGDISETIGGQEPHWARTAIEREYELRPLDVLTAENLASFDMLLLAQPRVLEPAENVALDDWVRAGGKLLLFADPLLTARTRFGLGDPRRPADVVLLSPILGRWGLELTFDPDQPAGEHMAGVDGVDIPTEMAGRFVSIGSSPKAPAECELAGEGIAAECAVGTGRALILADAALFDGDAAQPAARGEALLRLAARAYRPE